LLKFVQIYWFIPLKTNLQTTTWTKRSTGSTTE